MSIPTDVATSLDHLGRYNYNSGSEPTYNFGGADGYGYVTLLPQAFNDVAVVANWISETGGLPGPPGDDGEPGLDGTDGWTPSISVEADGDRRVMHIIGWVGGEGALPATGYIGPSGIVATAAEAANIRGPSGSGTGNVNGPSTSAANHIALFDNTSGDLLKDGGALGTAAFESSTVFASAAQGAKADSAVQPGSLATVATSGAYGDLSGRPTLGTAASAATGDFATAAQGGKADSALQPVAVGVTVQAYDAATAKKNAAGVWTAAQQFAVVSATTNAVTTAINCATGTFFTSSVSSARTFSISNAPSSLGYAFTLQMEYSGGAITWPGSVIWKDGTAPTFTSGKTYLIVMQTVNSGTTWRAAAMEFAG